MKRLLNTLYVTTQGSYLMREGDTVVVRVEKEDKLRVPLHALSGIVCFGRVSASPPLMGACAERDVAISLGDGLRPGCLADAGDDAQFAELDVMGELVERARAAGVQTIVEGPGHVPYDEIETNMRRQEAICDGAPFYVLGPVVTDVFPAYDHITSAIGATAAAYHGASFLCYVTPAEHLSLPTPEDVKAGCIATRIAAHAADVARKLPGARRWDDAMAEARAEFDWQRQFELAFDSDAAHDLRHRDMDEESDFCAMCGRNWCAVRISRELADRPHPVHTQSDGA